MTLAPNDPADHAAAPLAPLAELICRLEQQRCLTPVLVCPPQVVLADAFYVRLCQAAIEESGRNVRLDLLPNHWLAPLGDWWKPHHAGSTATAWLPVAVAGPLIRPTRKLAINRLAKQLPPQASIEATATVARPSGQLRDLVIGLAGAADQLPSFAEPVRFDLGLMGYAA